MPWVKRSSELSNGFDSSGIEMNLRLTLDEIFNLVPEAETEGATPLEEIAGIASLE